MYLFCFIFVPNNTIFLLNIIVIMHKIEVYCGSVVSVPISFIGILSFHYVGSECYDFDVKFDGLIKNHVLIPGDPDDPLGESSLCLCPVLSVDDIRVGFQSYRFTYINF